MKAMFVFALLISFTLSGCFFTKADDKPGGNKSPQNGGGLIQGLVSIVDIQGIDSKGPIINSDVLAEFVKKTDSKKAFGVSLHEELSDLERTTDREDPCQIKVAPKTQGVAQAFVSLGKLGFAVPGSQKLLEIPKQDNNQYYAKLNQGTTFPSGIYRFVSEGSADGPKFDTQMPMPTRFDSPSMNGQLFDNGPMQIKKTDGLQAQWGTPAKVEDYDRVFIRLIADTQTDTVRLQCSAKEKDLNGTGTTKWNIPASYLEKFAANMSKVEVYLFRADLIGKQGEAIGEIEFDGIRAWVMKASIVN